MDQNADAEWADLETFAHSDLFGPLMLDVLNEVIPQLNGNPEAHAQFEELSQALLATVYDGKARTRAAVVGACAFFLFMIMDEVLQQLKLMAAQDQGEPEAEPE